MPRSLWTTMSYPHAYREKNVADVHWEKRWQTMTWDAGDFPVLNSNLFLNSYLWVLQYPFASLSSLKLVCRDLLPFKRSRTWVFHCQQLGVQFLSVLCCLPNLEETCCPLTEALSTTVHFIFQDVLFPLVLLLIFPLPAAPGPLKSCLQISLITALLPNF